MKKILLVSADSILPYQPSILKLYDCLAKQFLVQIISFEQGFITKQEIENKNVLYIPNTTLAYKLRRKMDLYSNFFFKRISKIFPAFTFRLTCVKWFQIALIKQCVLQQKYDELIVVDFVALKAIQQLNLSCHFLSLEIVENDPFQKNIQQGLIKSVLIQSKIRFDYLFPHSSLPMWILPNATVYKKINIPKRKKNLLWQGSILKIFGIESCLEFICQQNKYQLVLKGGIEKKFQKQLRQTYKNELEKGLIVFDDGYIKEEHFADYVAQFKIGFCFYSWNLIRNNFNYRTAPSGKLFLYLLAGVPVIASDIEGFQFIKENKCGVLIQDYLPTSIQSAIDEIEANYAEYEANAQCVAAKFDFNQHAQAFIDFMMKDISLRCSMPLHQKQDK